MTAFEITYNDPALPKGTVVTVDGLGNLENGKSVVVSGEQHEQFRNHNKKQNFGWDNNGSLIVEEEPGPTLTQAFKDHEHIKVKSVKSDTGPTVSTDPVQPQAPEAPEDATNTEEGEK